MPRKLLKLKISEDKLDEYIDKYHSEGKSSREIGELIGCSEDSIRRRLKKRCMKLVKRPLEKSIPDFYNKIKILYGIGLSCTKIAILLGVTDDAIADNLRKIGVDVPKGAHYKYISEHDEYIKKRYVEDGISTIQIAKEINSTHGLIRNHLLKMNIPLRDIKIYHNKHSSERIGDRNPNWKGGVSQSHLDMRRSREYKEWRKQVYFRDNFQCKKCGSKKNLQAHHIKPFALFPEDRLNLDNGVTICEMCHKETHNKYGLGNIITFDMIKELSYANKT